MKLTSPFPKSYITQGFGGNANTLYAGQGLKGHTGIDYATINFHGTAIPSAADAWCYSTMNDGNPNPDYYRAVFTIVDDPDYSYEISYGHCSRIVVQEGRVAEGQHLADIGNTGDCYVGGRRVTKEEKLAGSTAGSHLHFQVRKCVRRKDRRSGYQYLRNSNGYYRKDGFYYEIVDYNNGYNGCVDPAQFFEDRFVFTKNLWYGQTGKDVLELQKRLGMDYSTGPGIFGPRTLAAVVKYQLANKIYPPFGFVGPITRARLNA